VLFVFLGLFALTKTQPAQLNAACTRHFQQILRNDGLARPLVVTTVDRLDIVLGLMGAQVGAHGPGVAGVLLCPAGHRQTTEGKAR
jgi:BioD-like phosphotransacetylase family protein